MPVNQGAGTDGIVPIYNPNEGWRYWALSEIYTGQQGANKYVPKVNDYVKDTDMNIDYIVTAVNQTSLIAELQEKKPYNMVFSISEEDRIFGVGSYQYETLRVYVDKTNSPYNLSVDTRWFIPGSLASYAKIFFGTDTSSSGTVISRVYDNNGNFVNEAIPLEVCAIDSHINYTLKIVMPCKTVRNLIDNEIVTVVAYDSNGSVVKKNQMLVENTSFIRSLDVSTKYITGIGLDSVFLSQEDSTQIQLPLNVNANALNIFGIVYYSDGSHVRLPADGTKFTMEGLDQFIGNIEGSVYDTTLFYDLGPNEFCIGPISNNNRIPLDCSIKTINPNNSYSVKLFVYPRYVNDTIGYELDWWLLNMDRNLAYNVNADINFSPVTGAFNGKAYNSLQTKSVYLNLNDVDGVFVSHNHYQTVDIQLFGTPTNNGTVWLVNNESLPSHNNYGLGLTGTVVNTHVTNLSSGITDYNEWLQKVYYNTYPLINTLIEDGPIVPTHMFITIGNDTIEVPVTSWNQDLTFTNTIVQYKLAIIKFIKRTPNGDLNLSVSGILVK